MAGQVFEKNVKEKYIYIEHALSIISDTNKFKSLYARLTNFIGKKNNHITKW